MKTSHFFNARRAFPALAICLPIAAAFLSGCGKSEIQTYRVAKDDNQTQAPAHAHAGGEMGERPALPHLHSEVPEGWRELPPEKMRLASYAITGENGQSANVAVIPLPGATKIELQSVNLWREQELGLGPINSEQLKELAEPVQVGDTRGILVDMASENAGTDAARIIGAVAERGNVTWFIKLAGTSSLVSEQKKNLVAYLKSLQFHDAAHGEPAQVASAERPVSTNTEKLPADSDGPNFKAPENWAEKAPGPMVTSAYTVSGENGQAEVSISKFPGSAGPMVDNINRWRGQFGLVPLPAADARKSAEMIEVAGKKDSYLIDIEGTHTRGDGKPARMVAAGVPHGGDTWYFKLVGPAALVAKEKEAFVRFMVSAY